ncbi:MAG: hypothetical protein AB8C46_17065 [Burkholderiaceae bacterium]
MSKLLDNSTDIPVELAMHLIQSSGKEDARLIRQGRLLSTTVMLRIGDDEWRMVIQAGKVTALQPGPFVMPSCQLLIGAPAAEWQLFWRPVPPPGSHDLFALLKRGVLTLDGDLHPFMSHLFYFKQLLAAARLREATV